MNKHKTGIIIAGLMLVIWSCKSKDKGESYLPVSSIIGAQIKDIDTSLYTIIKITYVDTIRSDTSYVRREEVRELAKDFLTLPEMSKKSYTEENIPGPTNGVSTFTYKPIHPEKEDLKQIDMIIDPSVEGETKTKITTIIIDRLFANRDSSVEKKLLWEMDKSFQVTTIKQLPGQPETYSSYKVIWTGVNSE